jgi:hypothetical protein
MDPPATGGPASPLNIAGATITLHAKATDVNGNPTGNDLPGSGVVVITDGPNGKFTYTPANTDFFVAGPVGTYICQWFYNFGGGVLIEGDYFTLVVQTTV